MNPAPLPIRVQHPPAERPLLIFDGDCNFCRYWVEHWKTRTGSRVDYAEAQDVSAQFPEIAPESFASAVQWVEPDGRVLAGADAVFRLYDFTDRQPLWLRFWQWVPGHRALARFGYAFIARHRLFFSRLWGTASE